MPAARSSTPSRRARARRGEGPRLREEILAAATRLLVETGDEEAVSIRAVAEAVGVTPPSIYLHFADKTELIFAVCEEQFRQLDAEMAGAEAGAADPLEALRRRGQAYVRFGLGNAEHYRVLFMYKDHVPEGVDREYLYRSRDLQPPGRVGAALPGRGRPAARRPAPALDRPVGAGPRHHLAAARRPRLPLAGRARRAGRPPDHRPPPGPAPGAPDFGGRPRARPRRPPGPPRWRQRLPGRRRRRPHPDRRRPAGSGRPRPGRHRAAGPAAPGRPRHRPHPLPRRPPVAGGLAAVHTPGHTPGHLSLLWPHHGGVLFCADALSNFLRVSLSPLNEDREQARRSLGRLTNLEFRVACFGHGRPVTTDAPARVRAATARHAPPG